MSIQPLLGGGEEWTIDGLSAAMWLQKEECELRRWLAFEEMERFPFETFSDAMAEVSHLLNNCSEGRTSRGLRVDHPNYVEELDAGVEG